MKAAVFAAALAIAFMPRALGQKHRKTVLRGYCRRAQTIPMVGHECVITSTQATWGPFPCPPTGEALKTNGDDSQVYRGCEFVGGECTYTTNEPMNTENFADCAAYLGNGKPVHQLLVPVETDGRPPNENNRPQGKGDGQQGKGNSQRQSNGDSQQGKSNTPQTKTTKKNTRRRGNMRRGNRV